MQNIRFVIVGTQRTGSSFLATSIEQHPELACGWEWTIDIPSYKRLSAAKSGLLGDFSGLSDKCRSHMQTFSMPVKGIGFRWLFSSSAKWLLKPEFSPSRVIERLTSFLRFVKSDPTIRIIHVTRNDDVGWLVSLYAAKTTGSYIGAKHTEDLRVSIPLKVAKKRLIAKRNLDRTLASLAQTNPYLALDYVEIESNPGETFKKVFEFLGVANEFNPQAKTQKQQNKTYQEIVENYDALMGCIRSI